MARLLDQIIIVDVESTCWEGSPPPGQASDIIEIGITRLDTATGERFDKRSIMVRPSRSTVSPFCTQLTTLTQADVDAGVSFEAACKLVLKDYTTKERAWASYGDYDRKQFERCCMAASTQSPFGASHINVKTLFALARGLKHEVGMAAALEMIGAPLEGTHHRGGDDAWNIAAILSSLLLSARRA